MHITYGNDENRDPAHHNSGPETNNEEEGKSLEYHRSDGGWRDNFKVGQCIDVLDTVDKWSEAEVVAVDGNRVLVHYIYWQSKWDEWIDKHSSRISPVGTEVYMENGVLKIGHRIEALDSVKKWLEAHVIQANETSVSP